MQPVRFWTEGVAVRPNPQYEAQSVAPSLPGVTISAALSNFEGAPAFRCQLDVSLPGDNPGEYAPYEIQLRVIGDFAFAQDGQPDLPAMTKMVAFNGLAMLYGFARDLILQQTTLSSHGPFLLPAVNLTQLAERIAQPAEQVGSVEPGTNPRPSRRRKRKADSGS